MTKEKEEILTFKKEGETKLVSSQSKLIKKLESQGWKQAK